MYPQFSMVGFMWLKEPVCSHPACVYKTPLSPGAQVVDWMSTAYLLFLHDGTLVSFRGIPEVKPPILSLLMCVFQGDVLLLMTFSVQLFLSLKQTLKSEAKVENSRCCSHRGRCQGPTGQFLLLPPFCTLSHGWRHCGWAGSQGLALKLDPLTTPAGHALVVPSNDT